MDSNQQPTQTTTPPPAPIEPGLSSPTPVQPVATPPATLTPENPGKTLGIVSFILSLAFLGLIGLILGIIAKKKSKQAGQTNGFALAGIIIGIVNIVVVSFVMFILAYNGVRIAAKCSSLGAGVHVVDGMTYNCPSNGSNSSSTN